MVWPAACVQGQLLWLLTKEKVYPTVGCRKLFTGEGMFAQWAGSRIWLLAGCEEEKEVSSIDSLKQRHTPKRWAGPLRRATWIGMLLLNLFLVGCGMEVFVYRMFLV